MSPISTAPSRRHPLRRASLLSLLLLQGCLVVAPPQPDAEAPAELSRRTGLLPSAAPVVVANEGAPLQPPLLTNQGAGLVGRVPIPSGIISNNGGSFAGRVRMPASLISDRGGSHSANRLQLQGYGLMAGADCAAGASPYVDAPAASAQVRLVNLDGTPIGPWTTTDAEGSFRLDQLPATPSRVAIVARLNGLQAVTLAEAPGGEERSGLVTDAASTALAGWTIARILDGASDVNAIDLRAFEADAARLRQVMCEAQAREVLSGDTASGASVTAAALPTPTVLPPAPPASATPTPNPAPTPTPTPTPGTGTSNPAPPSDNTRMIDQVIADMSAQSEAMVIDPRFDWHYKPAITMYSPKGALIPSWWTGNRPEWSYDVLTRFVAYEAQGNAATNTRVQIKDLRFYVLSESTRTWKRLDLKAAPPVSLWQYPFAPASGGSDMRNESTGGISVKPKYPNFHQGYGNSVTLDPQDVRAVFVAMDFRLAVDDPGKPDDRAMAKYVVDTGADYYPGNGQGDWSLGYAPGIGNSRMLLASPDWRSSTLLVPNLDHGATFEELRNNPPPLQ